MIEKEDKQTQVLIFMWALNIILTLVFMILYIWFDSMAEWLMKMNIGFYIGLALVKIGFYINKRIFKI